MPYGSGSPNGGSGPAFGGDTPLTQAARAAMRKSVPQTITKSIGYVAAGTNSTQVLAINKSAANDAINTADPRSVSITNTGIIPVIVMIGYEGYAALVSGNVHYVHALLHPGQTINPPVKAIIPTTDFLHLVDDTVLDFTAPDTNLYTNSGATMDDGAGADVTGSATETKLDIETWTSEIDHGANLFRIGDLVRVNDEIMEVTAINAGDDEDGAVSDETNLANTYLTVKRGLFGSTAASDHSESDIIRFPFFNEYYDYDRKLQGSTQLVSTDGLGRFKSKNLFGYARLTTGLPAGITPGSFCMKFYSKSYQEICFGPATSNIYITASTDSKLTAGQEYSLNLTIDDSVATTVSFTVDSNNTRFGGTSGITQKLNDAILTATRTAGNNLYGYSCTASITHGKLRFTSNSHLYPHDGTNGSKMLIETGAGGTTVFPAGIFPAIADINAPVPPELPDDVLYDPITYATSPNTSAFAYDRGDGSIIGMANGNLNYETGAIEFVGPKNASFQISFCYNGPFSGKQDATETARANSLYAVHANVLNKIMNGEVRISTT